MQDAIECNQRKQRQIIVFWSFKHWECKKRKMKLRNGYDLYSLTPTHKTEDASLETDVVSVLIIQHGGFW